MIELAELYRRIMAQLVASIAVSGRMPCNARCVGRTKMMSTLVTKSQRGTNACIMMRGYGNGGMFRKSIRESRTHVPCRVVRCFFLACVNLIGTLSSCLYIY